MKNHGCSGQPLDRTSGLAGVAARQHARARLPWKGCFDAEKLMLEMGCLPTVGDQPTDGVCRLVLADMWSCLAVGLSLSEVCAS